MFWITNTRERTHTEVLCSSKLRVKRCEFFDLTFCLREVAVDGIWRQVFSNINDKYIGRRDIGIHLVTQSHGVLMEREFDHS